MTVLSAPHGCPPSPAPARFASLVAVRLTETANRLRLLARRDPLKLIFTALFVVLIWASLYLFFYTLFDRLQATLRIESIVAIPRVFNFFFIVLTVMLAFSNGILLHGSLFNHREAEFLLSLPCRPAHIVWLKYLEALVLSSWSLILLGIPLMMAMSRVFEEPWHFYYLFVGFFLCFVPIPGALGLLGAWLMAMYVRGRSRRLLAAAGLALAAAALGWLYDVWYSSQAYEEGRTWIRHLLDRAELVRSALLPSTWVSQGIDHAVHDRPSESLFYLLVTLVNALFLSYFVVRLTSWRLHVAYARATSRRADPLGRLRWTAHTAAALLWFLPRRWRSIVAKDVTVFLRDPLQWAQLVILFGLMGLYVANIPRINPDFDEALNQILIPYLNVAAATLIITTFTSRFVYPLVSLETDNLWILGVVPVPRRWFVLSKFIFSLAITIACAISVTVLSGLVLRLSLAWLTAQIVVMLSACVGLCGLAVGLGARFPVIGQRNATRIASGLGGTINLVVSMLYMVLVLALLGGVALRMRLRHGEPVLDTLGLALIGAIVLLSAMVAAAALHAGTRRFERLEV